MKSRRQSIHLMARAIVAGPATAEAARERLLQLIEPPAPRWLKPFCRRLEIRFDPTWIPPKEREVAEWIQSDRGFGRAWMRGKVKVRTEVLTAVMRPYPGEPETWELPSLTDSTDLAKWLRFHPDDLGWLTAYGQADHYLYRWHQKRSSGAGRLIEVPKPMLKRCQRALLDQLLARIPAHEAAHGFCRGRSVRSFVTPHTGQAMVLKVDLEDFFPTITSARVRGIFLAAGYPEPVAHRLTRLCTHATPEEVLAANPASSQTPWMAIQRLRAPHLPQGAPTSPPLANLCAFKLDCRLNGLAKSVGAAYTRYADDLLFSGDGEFARRSVWFLTQVLAVIMEEGFTPNVRKTRFMRSGRRQYAAGAILNAHPNIPRQEFDRLKAILTNCHRHGPASQNRAGHEDFRAHLLGRIAWIVSLNPGRGEKLRGLFERVRWDD